jgi:3-oxoacyl-[acyl-carrier protein] reductase
VSGQVAIVSGAAQGLGEAIARRLHADGWSVLLGDVNEAGALLVARELGEGAGSCLLDVRSPLSWQEALEQAVARFGHVDALVNNAARTEFRSLFDIPLDEWDDVLAVNLRGTYLGITVVGSHLRDRGYGRIVNLASIAGQAASGVTGAHYAASKAGVVALTRRAAAELAPHGVTVNAVAPAAIDGPLVATVPPERVEAMVRAIPVRRLGRPGEVAALVAWLLSDEAGFVTGATLDVNGGLLMR